ncbi:HAD hydrolase-like protein [Corynebacterium uterequi]|nr:HAD hydrolase-like protein [Corynebacterium uterequi]
MTTLPDGRRILFFDVDGTLIDSFPAIKASFLHALDEVGIPRPDAGFIASIAGPPMETTLGRLNTDPAVVTAAMEAYLAHQAHAAVGETRAFDGVGELLDELRAEGFYLSTATSKGEGICRRVLSHLGLLDKLDFIAAAEEFGGARRTKEQVIAFALDSLGLRERTADILMIGDRRHDIVGAAEFAIPTCAVTWGYGTAEEWDSAAWKADTTAELKEIIHDFAR